MWMGNHELQLGWKTCLLSRITSHERQSVVLVASVANCCLRQRWVAHFLKHDALYLSSCSPQQTGQTSECAILEKYKLQGTDSPRVLKSASGSHETVERGSRKYFVHREEASETAVSFSREVGKELQLFGTCSTAVRLRLG